MKYQLNTGNYHTFDLFEVNRLPARSHLIPYSDRAGRRHPQGEALQLLQSALPQRPMDFKFYPRPAELPNPLDTDAVSFDKIDVPACRQFRYSAKQDCTLRFLIRVQAEKG